MGALRERIARARPLARGMGVCAVAVVALGAAFGSQLDLGAQAAEAAPKPVAAGGSPAGKSPGGELLEGAAIAQTPRENSPQPESAEAVNEQIARLIKQLGDPDYVVRQRAQAALAEMGFEAFDALMAASADPDLEIAARARYLVRLLSTQWVQPDDPPEVRRLLADYQSQAEQEKRRRIRLLATLPDGQGLGALLRVVRREQSEVLSKWAAIEWIRQMPAGPARANAVAGIEAELGHSRRSAAQWVVAWAKLLEDAAAGLPNWSRLVAVERQRLSRSPDQTSAEIVAAVLRLEIEWEKRLGQTDQAMQAMHWLIELDSSDPELLAELVEWLIGQKAWEAVERLAARSQAQFESDPVLLYMLAEAQALQGRGAEAEQTARRAAALNPGAAPENLINHLSLAFRLRERGLFRWAEREYRYVTSLPAPNRQITYMAWLSLAEMLHDQGEHQQAAEALRSALALQAEHGDAETAGRDAQELRSRMHFFQACHFADANDLPRQREELDKAIQIDPPDLDALIARYRLPGTAPAERARLVELIRQTAAELEQFIVDDPENPTWYNQYAWLVGNTEGNLDKALKYSRRSIELRPDAGAYYDTLAHVYFARGEYQKAVESQERAAELEPHSRVIREKLELFRARLDEQRRAESDGPPPASPPQPAPLPE